MNEQEFNKINAEKLTNIVGVNGTIATITTANLPTADLPTAEEYRESINDTFRFPLEWSEPKYQCPQCGGGMCRNEMVVLASYPPQREYRCNKCGHVEYQYR